MLNNSDANGNRIVGKCQLKSFQELMTKKLQFRKSFTE